MKKLNEEKLLKTGRLWEAYGKKRVYFYIPKYITITDDNGKYDRTINGIRVNECKLKRSCCRKINDLIKAYSGYIYYDFDKNCLVFSVCGDNQPYQDIIQTVIKQIEEQIYDDVNED